MLRLLLTIGCAGIVALSCNTTAPPKMERSAHPEVVATGSIPKYSGKLPLEKLRLREGFRVHVFAENVKNARSLCLSPNGTLFVSTRTEGKVYALRDTNGDKMADQKFEIAKGLDMPNGVAFRNGSLFVAEVSRILRFDDIEKQLARPPAPVVVFDKYPTEGHHGWKYIAFGPDGRLYVPVGAPCNICEPKEAIFCSITRLNPDGTGLEIVQRGIRNTVGFTWHPTTKELWFTDNGRDWMGDDLPACELNHAPRDSMHFGYPYCHQGDLPDPEFGHRRSCKEFVPPVQNLGAHVAPLGLEFVTSHVFPQHLRHHILIAEHGSWNRSKKSGYKISLVRLDEQHRSIGYEDFITGWLQPGDDVWGRPVDLEWMPDGSLLISDDFAHAIYRVVYVP